MSRFYISQIAASGDSVKFSTVDFKDGINEHDYVVKSNEVFRGCLLYTSPSPRD